jgi:VWFA-related protein
VTWQKAALGVLLMTSGGVLLAQESVPFRAATRLVVLQATVRDMHDRLVTDLDQHAFTVFENGKRQPITLFRRDDVPVSIGLLIDNSGSMRPLRANVEAAALAFARASNPLDEMFVLNFADKVNLDVPFTSDPGVLERGIARVDSIGGTALHDAIDTAQTYLGDHAMHDRKALLVITDGIDNASVVSMERIEQQAERTETVIYAIGLFGADLSTMKRGRRELDELTRRTGGLSQYPASIDEVGDVAIDLARRIRRQYTIAYAPLDQALDGTYRTIRVTAQRAGEHLTVRARPGYRATAGGTP